MAYAVSLLAAVSLAACAVIPFVLGRCGLIHRISVRNALLGAISYMTFCYYLGNGLGLLLANMLSPLVGESGLTLLNAGVYAVMSLAFVPSAYRALWRLFFDGCPTEEEVASVAYGMAVAQLALTLLGPVASLAMGLWSVPESPTDVRASAYYLGLSPAYGIFLASAAPAVMTFHAVAGRRLAEGFGGRDLGEALLTAAYVALFSLAYQYVPTIPVVGFGLGASMAWCFVVIAWRLAACRTAHEVV